MAYALGDRIGIAQGVNELSERAVLRLFEGNIVAALELDTDGEVITSLATAPLRHTRVPGAHFTRYELHKFSVAPDQKMCGDCQRRDLTEIWVGLRIKAVCEQFRDGISAKTAWRQADAVNDDEFDATACRTSIAIWRRHLPSRTEQTGRVKFPPPAAASISKRSQLSALS